jgi:hypothetical protein
MQEAHYDVIARSAPLCDEGRRSILAGRYRRLTNRRPSQPVGSSPLLKIIEANFRLPAVAGIQVITLFRLAA